MIFIINLHTIIQVVAVFQTTCQNTLLASLHYSLTDIMAEYLLHYCYVMIFVIIILIKYLRLNSTTACFSALTNH